jgi:feruloyl esterase
MLEGYHRHAICFRRNNEPKVRGDLVKRAFSCAIVAAVFPVIYLTMCVDVFAANCDGITSITLPETTITLATAVSAGTFTPPTGAALNNLPGFCEVHGVLKPTPASVIHFEVWMPLTNWNSELEGIGNGGLAGTISFGPMANALRAGFATVSTDTGHDSKEPATWLQNRERLIDYSYRGLHLATVTAKAIVDAFYGQSVSHSYFLGCSTGGKQGLMEAQRFPADYDGIVAGDAANFWTRQMMNEVWDGIATSTPETNLSRDKLQLIQDAALAVCDALDGLKDGIISDPTHCRFDPKSLPICKEASETNCLTNAELAAVQKLYSGPVDPRSGKSLYPGFYPGGELGWGRDGGQMVINRTTTSGVSSYDFFRYALFGKPDWDWRTFNFATDIEIAEEKLAAITNATNPNLDEFRRLNHKLLYYHGTADPLIPAQNGINYYETVVSFEGGGAKGTEQTQQFFRVFLVPGLYHCSGGPGASGFGGNTAAPVRDAEHDLISAVSRWVEEGVAPDKITATKYVGNAASNGIAMQRPLCAYPAIPRYKGNGDANDAVNFVCEKR